MLNLDGAALDMDGREFSYDIPAPFGPERGPAVLKIKAKPAATVNAGFRAGLDEVMHKAKVKDRLAQKAYDASDDVEAFTRQQTEDARAIKKAIAELNYDHCIVDWSTTIQSAGKDIEPTRENFLELSGFEHPAIHRLFEAIKRDLANHEKFSITAELEAEAEAEKN